MIVLGIDPGYATVGVAIIEQKNNKVFSLLHKAIITKAHLPLSTRCLNIVNELSELIKKYKPTMVGIESLFFSNNSKTAIDVAQARGAIILCCEQHGVTPINFTPLQVKVSICGYGGAKKDQVQRMVKKVFNLEKIPKPDDVADALAIAFCAANTSKVQFLNKGFINLK